MSFWGELRRRNVVKVAIAYLIASWLIVQVVGVLTDPLSLPDVLDTVVVVLLAIGFVFALVIAWVYEVTPEGIRATSEADTSRDFRSASGQRLTYVVMTLLVMAIALLVFERMRSPDGSVGLVDRSRIAILPCFDRSPDPSNSYFAAGMHDELISRLSAVPSLSIVPRGSVQQYEGFRRPTIPEIAAALDVDIVMECGATYSGDSVLLTVELIDPESNEYIYSDRFPGNMNAFESIFELHAEIGRVVTQALEAELTPADEAQLARISTESREAYELFLASTAVFRSAGWEAAIDLLDEAIEIDDSFAEAWSRKADILIQGTITDSARSLELQALAEVAAQEAVRLDPNLADAYTSLGYALSQRLDWVGAEHAYRRAIEINEQHARIATYSLVLLPTGRFEQARQVLENASRLRPAGAPEFSLLIFANLFLGDRDRAIAQYERLRQTFVNPQFADAAMRHLYVASGELDRARNIPPPIDPVNQIAIEYLETPDAALSELKRFFETNNTLDPASLMGLAVWAAHFGDNALAMDALRQSKQQSALGTQMIWLPQFGDLRTTAPFRDFLRDFGFVEYWQEFGWPELCRPIGSDEFECS